jgi:hypothetical protein
MGDMRNAYKFVPEYSKGRHHVGDLDVDGRIVLKLILTKKCTTVWN